MAIGIAPNSVSIMPVTTRYEKGGLFDFDEKEI